MALNAKKLREGVYRAVLYLDEEQKRELPFNMEVQYRGKRPLIIIRNADEKIVVDEIHVRGDSVSFRMPVFDTEFRLLFVKDGLEGVWINNYRSSHNRIRFKAFYGEENRFLSGDGPTEPVFEGSWEVTFSPASENPSKAIGVFHHTEQSGHLTGTFMTATGDYRFLEGVKEGNRLYLSAFDGSHAYLFEAALEGSVIKGMFYSGSHHQEAWTAVRNPDFSLPQPETLTYMKDAEQKLDFVFPDLEGRPVSLADKRFKGRPVIVQVMGSWCPNCMDESRYLAALYREYKPQGLEIVALAFEKTAEPEKATAQVTRMKNRLQIEYPILITQQTGKEAASRSLSALNGISSFPTTIFLNRDHRVVKIHTGFSGPATGAAYDKFKEETEGLIQKLLKE